MCLFGIDLPDEKPLWKVPIKSYAEGFNDGYHAAQVDTKGETIKAVLRIMSHEYKTVNIEELLDILESLPIK